MTEVTTFTVDNLKLRPSTQDAVLHLSLPIEKAAMLAPFMTKLGTQIGVVFVDLTEQTVVRQQPVSVNIPKEQIGNLCLLAVQLCKQDEFADFIIPVYDRYMDGDGSGFGDLDDETREDMDTEDICSHAIKVMCKVESRKYLDTNPIAAELFHNRIRKPFLEWQKQT